MGYHASHSMLGIPGSLPHTGHILRWFLRKARSRTGNYCFQGSLQRLLGISLRGYQALKLQLIRYGRNKVAGKKYFCLWWRVLSSQLSTSVSWNGVGGRTSTAIPVKSPELCQRWKASLLKARLSPGCKQ